jgi:hypothetical protein
MTYGSKDVLIDDCLCREHSSATIKANHCFVLVDTIGANVNNYRLSDSEFRQFIKNSLPDYIETPYTSPNPPVLPKE